MFTSSGPREKPFWFQDSKHPYLFLQNVLIVFFFTFILQEHESFWHILCLYGLRSFFLYQFNTSLTSLKYIHILCFNSGKIEMITEWNKCLLHSNHGNDMWEFKIMRFYNISINFLITYIWYIFFIYRNTTVLSIYYVYTACVFLWSSSYRKVGARRKHITGIC